MNDSEILLNNILEQIRGLVEDQKEIFRELKIAERNHSSCKQDVKMKLVQLEGKITILEKIVEENKQNTNNLEDKAEPFFDFWKVLTKVTSWFFWLVAGVLVLIQIFQALKP